MAAFASLLTAIFFFLNLPNSSGFSVDLIHRDSPKSPFYNSSESLSDRMSRAIRQSYYRVNYILSSTTSAYTHKDVSSEVLPNRGTYLMTISLGTPPVEILAVVDTGSNLIWTQCSPCQSCYKQDAPLFDSSKSSTYKETWCDNLGCFGIPVNGCNSDLKCNYSYAYSEGSYTRGVLATEVLTMTSSGGGSSVNIPNIYFGCGRDNGGLMDSREAGVVGLGGGPLSLISQLGPIIGNKNFSHCFVPFYGNAKNSRMDFGDSAEVSGDGTVYTPLFYNPPFHKTVYNVNLRMISVGTRAVYVPVLIQGNAIIDTGTTATYLPPEVYQNLMSAFKDAIDLPPTKNPSIQPALELCYEFGKDFKVPDLKIAFDAPYEVVFGSLNTIIPVNSRVSCAAFISFNSSNSTAILGNILLQNFKIGYDLT